MLSRHCFAKEGVWCTHSYPYENEDGNSTSC